MADWSNLLDDLLVLIAERLIFLPDLNRFAFVCVQWRVVAMRIRGTFPSRPPLLMLPYEEGTQTCSFLHLSENLVYGINLPELRDKWICGASDGWLVTLDDHLDINLLNPYSRAQIQLPQHPAIARCLEYVTPKSKLVRRGDYMIKVVLSGSPTSSSGCFVAAIVSKWFLLAICKVGGDEWITIGTEKNQYSDVTYYKGKIYAIRFSGPLVVCDVGPDPKITMIELPQDQHARQKYVVESSGDLLLVKRYVKYYKKRNPYYETCKFHVHKLNQSTKGWSKVENLGDRSLFLGGNRSLSVSASRFFGCRPNSIYFIDDYIEAFLNNTAGCQVDCGVYNLEDGRIEPLSPDAFPIWPVPAFWCMQSM